jgi:hypothetical protein
MKSDLVYEIVLRRLLREGHIDLGDVEFSPNRIDDVRTDEENTEEEDYLFDDLETWIRHTIMGRETAQNIEKLSKSKKYGDFFRTLKSGTVYRGIKIPWTTFIGSEWMDDMSAPMKSKPIPTDITYRSPHDAGVSSWTYDKEEARQFALNRVIGKDWQNVSIVMHANASDNPGIFLDLSWIQDRITIHGVDKYRKEREVLALDDVVLERIEWEQAPMRQNQSQPGSIGQKIKAALKPGRPGF